MRRLDMLGWTIRSLVCIALASGCNNVAGEAQYPREGVPCHRVVFETGLIHDACAKGGQLAAQLAMTKFAKDHEVYSCLKCHRSLAPNYPLRPEALHTFESFGGTLAHAVPSSR